MQELPLNLLFFVFFILGLFLNWQIPSWEFTLKKTIGNLATTVTAFLVTQFWITATPQTLWGKGIYAFVVLGFSLAPAEIGIFIGTLSQRFIKSKGSQIEGNLESKDTK